MPAPTLDGTATGIATAATTVAATLTTTGANDIICALVYVEHTSAHWITGVAGGGLTWNKRTQATFFGSFTESLELWWAVAATALTSATITATGNSAWDNATILLFGVSGCNTGNPWDSNASLGTKLINSSASIPPSFSSISTSQANDFLIFAWGSRANQAAGTPPTGFTSIGSRINSGGTAWASLAAAYRGVTAAQSNQTFAWGSSVGQINASIFDALTADTGGSTLAPRPAIEAIATGAATTTNTVSLNTVGISSGNVIVLIAYCEQAGASGGGPAITSVSGGGLAWTQKARSHASTRGSLEIWAAQVTGTLALSAITVSYAANFDNVSPTILSISGCHSTIWEPAAPAMQSNTTTGTWTPSVSVTTLSAHDLLLATVGTAFSTLATATPPTGYIPLIQIANTGGTAFAYVGIGSQNRAATQSATTTAWGAAIADQASPNQGGEYVVLALTADAPAIVPSTARQYAVSVIS